MNTATVFSLFFGLIITALTALRCFFVSGNREQKSKIPIKNNDRNRRR